MTQKPTDELTPAELRRAIAELLGYHVLPNYFPVSDRTGYALVDRDGAAVGHGYNYWFEEEPWGECPDWPGNPGAALALCLEIARKEKYILRTDPNWDISGFNPTLIMACFWDNRDERNYASGATPALALSRLAHAALTESETRSPKTPLEGKRRE